MNKLLVGNKCDLTDKRVVSYEAGKVITAESVLTSVEDWLQLTSPEITTWISLLKCVVLLLL